MRKEQTLLLLFGTFLPLAAQIQGPQLGFLSRDGELRRIEGLSVSSRLSAPLALPLACTRVSAAPGAAMRWALCATEDATLLMDLSGGTESPRKVADAPYVRAIWSANGKALLLDGVRISGIGQELAIAAASATDAQSISDTGVVGEGGVLAFDGEARITVDGSAVRRSEPGQAEEVFALDFAATYVAATSDSIVAAAGKRLARISRNNSGEIAYFELPVDASLLRLLADGSVLFAEPGTDEPGWLFRWNRDEGGSIRFVPGIPSPEAQQTEQQQQSAEVRQ